MKITFIILVGVLLSVTLCIVYSALVVASRQDEADEKEQKRRSIEKAERFFEKGDDKNAKH